MTRIGGRGNRKHVLYLLAVRVMLVLGPKRCLRRIRELGSAAGVEQL